MTCTKHIIHYRLRPGAPIKCLTCTPPPAGRIPVDVGVPSSSGELVCRRSILAGISLSHVRFAERDAWRAAALWGAGEDEFELVHYDPADCDEEGWPKNSRIPED